jgi:cation transport ATPase
MDDVIDIHAVLNLGPRPPQPRKTRKEIQNALDSMEKTISEDNVRDIRNITRSDAYVKRYYDGFDGLIDNKKEQEENKQRLRNLQNDYYNTHTEEDRERIEEMNRRQEILRREEERQKNEMNNWIESLVVHAAKAEKERTRIQLTLILAYAASAVLSVIGVVSFGRDDINLLVTFPWVAIVVLTVVVWFSGYNRVSLAIIGLFALGAVMWAILFAAAILEIAWEMTSLDAGMMNVTGSAIILAACIVPIYPIYRQFLSIKREVDEDIDVEDLLVKAFGRR